MDAASHRRTALQRLLARLPEAFRAAAIVGAASLVGVGGASGQVAPGPLARSHASVDGALNCFKCHGAGGERALDANCLACHREIQSLVARGGGVHGAESKPKCASCHREHKGDDAALIFWADGAADKFDHTRAGWTLAGAHARAKCEACHGRKEFKVAPLLALAPGQKAGKSYIGLDGSCGTCHEDIHKRALGLVCQNCHSTESWKAPHFDHQKTNLPLRGKHADVACAKCHMDARLPLPRDRQGVVHPLFKPVPHTECGDCHKDPHAQKLGAACSRCHDDRDFRVVRAGNFEHDRTRYPLRGRHAVVDCARCHDREKTGWKGKPAFARCGSCHRDAHARQAAIGGRPADCDGCHSVERFTPSTFTAEKHATSVYPLAGRHAQTVCAKCHPKKAGRRVSDSFGAAGVVLRPAHAVCRDCHAEAHGRQLDARKDGGACESCHDVKGFKKTTFTVADHNKLSFPLAGRHAAAQCTACHGPAPATPDAALQARFGDARFAFWAPKDCVGCHWDPHRGRFADGGERPVAKGCAACHGDESFRPSLRSESAHREAGFPLEGAHDKAACELCHSELKAAPAASSVLTSSGVRRELTFREDKRRCEECHKDPHRGQFGSRPDRGACGTCHGTETFAFAATFDHQRTTRFALKGAHARIACARCHEPTVDDAGQRVTIYKGLGMECKDCHSSSMDRRREERKPRQTVG